MFLVCCYLSQKDVQYFLEHVILDFIFSVNVEYVASVINAMTPLQLLQIREQHYMKMIYCCFVVVIIIIVTLLVILSSSSCWQRSSQRVSRSEDRLTA